MMQLSPDGQQLWIAGRYDGAIYVLNASNGKVLKTISTGIKLHGLTYSPSPGASARSTTMSIADEQYPALP
jgi:YVTN family beta-propeller protein